MTCRQPTGSEAECYRERPKHQSDDRIDLSLADGDAKERYGWIDPNQDLFLNELDGKIGEHELSTDTNIGHIKWHIKATRASEK